ncbi:MAG TPA: preprotein translocase subunit SecG [Candidatus Eisenbacteria bacterium]|nr:preprotein translocase subunit SecG [Candidatus Eisenbacteria bacterium]
MSGFMIGLISVLHVLTCVALMVTILLQSGKGGGLAGSFGGGTSQTLFGGRGAATFLSRGATILAVVFFLTSLTLGLSSSRSTAVGGRSLIQEEARQRAREGQQAAPAAPPMGGSQAPGQGVGAPPAGTPAATTPQATAPQTTTPRPATQQAPAPNAQQQAPSAPTPPATAPSTQTQPPASQEGTQAPQGNGTP